MSTKVAIPQTQGDRSRAKQITSMKKNTEESAAQIYATDSFSRRAFLTKVPLAGAIALSPLSALAEAVRDDADDDHGHLKESDKAILIAAEIAEALAVTTYTNIINLSPFFPNIPDDDQDYLRTAREEEMSHYLLEQSVTNQPTPFTMFFYPPNMFIDSQTTLNVLATLEDAFIAAYLVGVRHFSTANVRVTAARIMGIESDHRTLADIAGHRFGFDERFVVTGMVNSNQTLCHNCLL